MTKKKINPTASISDSIDPVRAAQRLKGSAQLAPFSNDHWHTIAALDLATGGFVGTHFKVDPDLLAIAAERVAVTEGYGMILLKQATGSPDRRIEIVLNAATERAF